MGAVRVVGFRGGAAALAVALVALSGVFGSAPAQAAAVAGLATTDGAVATSASSSVVVSWDGKTETIELSLGLRSSAGTVGLLLPTPSRATVSAGDSALFDAVDRAIAPTQHREDDWWGRTAPVVAPVAAVEASPIGTVAPTAIKATNKTALSKWLKKHSLVLSKADRTQLAEYASDGWSLSLLAIDSSAAVDGDLAPVSISFATKNPVVPMRLAATGTTPTDLRIFSVGEHRTALRIAGTSKNLNAAQTVVWAGPTSTPALTALGDYLTVTDVRFDSPDAQVTGDIGLVDAPADDTLMPSVVVYSPITLLGIPLGWLLVVWGGIGALLAVAYLVNRFRSQ
jgi:hypothetical protein